MFSDLSKSNKAIYLDVTSGYLFLLCVVCSHANGVITNGLITPRSTWFCSLLPSCRSLDKIPWFLLV